MPFPRVSQERNPANGVWNFRLIAPNGEKCAYPFLAYEAHQPCDDTAFPERMAQGTDEEPVDPLRRT